MELEYWELIPFGQAWFLAIKICGKYEVIDRHFSNTFIQCISKFCCRKSMFLLAETPKKKVPQRWEHTLCGQSSVQILKFVGKSIQNGSISLLFFPKIPIFLTEIFEIPGGWIKISSSSRDLRRSQRKTTTEDLLRMAAAAMDSMVKVPPHTSTGAEAVVVLCFGGSIGS